MRKIRTYRAASLLAAIAICALNLFAKIDKPSDYSVEYINKDVREIAPAYNTKPGTPLEYYRMKTWVRLNGKESLWRKISTKRFDFNKEEADIEVDSVKKESILNERLISIISYRDSAAAIITALSPDFLIFNYSWIEDGRWVNGGEGMGFSLKEAEDNIRGNLPQLLKNIPRIEAICQTPQDVTPFAEYLAKKAEVPERFLLNSLKSHRLVINGEFHRRKVSWDMLTRLISMPEFANVCGVVFMELPSWHQATMDNFMNADTLNPEHILDIFRDEQPNGWWDKGEFEFICKLWEINRKLPKDKRINAVLADYQVPYSKITSKEEAKELEERNTHMADIIENYLSTSDKRSAIFLVGCAHAHKSHTPAIQTDGKRLSAGAQLAERLGDENVFTVFQHNISIDNSGRNRKLIRGGIFDKAFELNGNKPIGFDLENSPFGAEPFDGIFEIKFDHRTGNFEDNYDCYLFLHSLEEEPQNGPLLEIFTQEFVDEMKRRAEVLGLMEYRAMWFGVTAPELTREKIIKNLTD